MHKVDDVVKYVKNNFMNGETRHMLNFVKIWMIKAENVIYNAIKGDKDFAFLTIPIDAKNEYVLALMKEIEGYGYRVTQSIGIKTRKKVKITYIEVTISGWGVK